MKNTIIIIIFLASGLLWAQIITPIANIQDSVSVYNGQNVNIEGVITIGAGVSNDNLLNVFIQDSSGRGIMLFDYVDLIIFLVLPPIYLLRFLKLKFEVLHLHPQILQLI